MYLSENLIFDFNFDLFGVIRKTYFFLNSCFDLKTLFCPFGNKER